MDSATVVATAERLKQARLNGQPVPELTAGERPETEDEGYAVQAALAEALCAEGKGPVAGYKIGATTPSMQSYLGVPEPAFGRILAPNVLRSPAEFRTPGHVTAGIECEIAIRLSRDVPANRPITTVAEATSCIDEVYPAIEIVENRYGDFKACGVPTLMADDFFHRACVIGAPVSEWRDIALDTIEGRTRIDGVVALEGRSADVLGHPLNSLVWLSGRLAGAGLGLTAGMIVMTGSITPVHWVERFPCDAVIEIDGLGRSELVLSRE